MMAGRIHALVLAGLGIAGAALACALAWPVIAFGFLVLALACTYVARLQQRRGLDRALRLLGRARARTADMRKSLSQAQEEVQCLRTHAAAQQQEQQERQHNMLHPEAQQVIERLSGDGLVVVDASGLIRRINRCAEELTGWPAHRAIGRSHSDIIRLINPQTRATLSSPAQRVRSRTSHMLHGEESLLLTRGGAERRVVIAAQGLQGGGTVIALRDVTARNQLELRFREAQKLESVGRLASGVAHDFNNLLTGILGNAEMLQLRVKDDERALRQVRAIHEAGERGAELTKQLLGCAGRSRQQDTAVNLHQLIEGVLRMTEHALGTHIRVQCQLQAAFPTVHGDASHLQSALLNLVLNAKDAMPNGGDLTLISENKDLDEVEASRLGCAAGPVVVIEVRDSGVGMDSHTLSKIFEPFFTTKPRGLGTGLGLPAVLGCMQEHGGMVSVKSEEGSGSSFFLYLPCVQDALPEEARKQETARWTAGGTVLVVDDEEIIRTMLCTQLDAWGYQTKVAEHGLAACAIIEGGEQVDAVIIDLVMPVMNGTTACQRLRAKRPQLPIVLCSGYRLDVEQQPVPGPRLGFLQKPFETQALRKALREVLSTV